VRVAQRSHHRFVNITIHRARVQGPRLARDTDGDAVSRGDTLDCGRAREKGEDQHQLAFCTQDSATAKYRREAQLTLLN